MSELEYVPGVCNIGPAEVARRRAVGWIGLVVTLVLLAALVWAGANPCWRLVIFVPAMLSAAGFLQARAHFCTGFAHRGVFNFGALGQTSAIDDEDSRAADRKTGNRIMWQSVLTGLVAAAVSVAIR